MWTADKLMYSGVSYDAAYSGETLVWRKRNYEDEYFTLDVVSGGTLGWGLVNATAQVETMMLEYSLNGGEWTTLSTTVPLNVSAGDSIRVKNPSWVDNYKIDGMHFYGTAYFNVSGNIMSLVYNDFVGKTSFPADRQGSCIRFVFHNSNVIDASNLVLPVTALTYLCYADMFAYCASLSAAPALPATTLADHCYQEMFNHCTSLVSAPELPATTLSYGCYFGMFNHCSRLNSIKCMATTDASWALHSWTNGVSATGTFTKASSATFWTTGADGIPSGWTVVDA